MTNMKGQQAFSDRITRIETGDANTFETVFMGLQDANTPKDKAVSGVKNFSRTAGRPTKGALMRKGLIKGMAQASLCLVGAGLYLHYTTGF